MMIAFLVLLGALVPAVSGFSRGAGSCAGNGAPVGGKHLNRLAITSGTLEAYNITISLGESGDLETGVAFEFEYGKPHYLTLASKTVNSPYLGFLVRLSSPDGIDTTAGLAPLSSDTETQVATDTCINIEGVGGITHTNNDPKTVSQSILEMDEAAVELILDVTVVVANAGFFSDFYYSQYILNAVAPAEPPGGTPSTAQGAITVPTTPDFQVTRPTTPDVVYPPIKQAGGKPAKKGEGSPVASLDLAPIAAPVATPVASPDAAPVKLPVGAPAAVPTVDGSPTGTVAGVQDNSPTGASSGALGRRGTTGFTAYATLSLLAFTSFCFAL
jgi:hypothetical protein